VPGLGRNRYDLAFGGAFYAYVSADQVGLKCTPDEFRPLIEKGMAIKRAVMKSREIPHPFEKELSFLYGTILIAPPIGKGANSRNVCIFAEGEVDRSPTGTGVSGRMAIHFARKEVTVNQPIVIESILGTQFIGRVVETTRFGPFAAVIPEVEGSASITGRNEFFVDPEDPLRNGFILR
jgi:trans-L-3-hydroxyproline dehydratase